ATGSPGNYRQAYKVANTAGGQTYVLATTTSASAKWRFENAEFVTAANQASLFWGNGTVTDGQFQDCLLSSGSTLGKCITNWDLYAKTRPLFRRCKFTSTAAVSGGHAVTFENTVDLLLDSCIGEFVGNGCYIGNTNTRPRVIGAHDPASGNYNQWVAADPAHISATPLAIGTGGDDPLTSRPTCVLVEDVLVVGDGYSHTLMLDADGCVCRNATVFIGTGGPGGLGIVHKFGTGYSTHGCRVYSGVPTLYDAESQPGIYTTTPADKTQGSQHHGVLFKGVADVVFDGGAIDIECAGGFCFQVYNTVNATGYTGRACKNVAITKNRIVTGSTSYAWAVVAADPTGYLVIDENEYTLGGSGVSTLWTHPIVASGAESQAAMVAAWANGAPGYAYSTDPTDATTGYAAIPPAWRVNDSHAYPLPAASLVVAGTDRGDGVVGTYPTMATTQSAEYAIVNAAKSQVVGEIVMSAGTVEGEAVAGGGAGIISAGGLL
ncbi:MAG: hypothetical protein LLG00_13445, partial [Planctomycetaceae bacterium]|nr:hypothetical protein [Planctomycetaceae bacterium]